MEIKKGGFETKKKKEKMVQGAHKWIDAYKGLMIYPWKPTHTFSTFTLSHGVLDQTMCPGRNPNKATWCTMYFFYTDIID